MCNEPKPVHGENKRAHLSMIQGVINRLGGNLFFLKGWAVTLIIGLLAASLSFDENLRLQYVLTGVLLLFWGYDAYFLSLERCYRDLYDAVRKKNEDEIDFTMDIAELKKYAKNTWIGALFSITLLAFYPLLGGIIFVIINLI